MRLKTFFIFLMLSLYALAMPEGLKVSLVNFYPGSEIYELEGHSAIRVQDAKGMDVAISYGTFDFNAPNFVYRYVKGETDYWVSAYPWQPFIYSYLVQGRSVIEHPVLMDSLQLERFWQLINENLQPQNAVYRYNYVKDNCATRPLGILEKSIGDSIIVSDPCGDAALSGDTFRNVMRHYHKNYPWYQFGIDLALGSGIDYKINAREKTFAPIVLDSQLETAHLASGEPVFGPPIVLNAGKDATLGPTPWILSPMAVSLAILLIVIAVSYHDIRNLVISRWLDTILYTIYGLMGCLIAFLIFFSVHEATSPNYLFLWLNPLCLIVPIFIWLKKCKYVVLSYQIANFALLFTMAVIWPFCGQSGNPAFLPLILADAIRAITFVYVYYKQRNN